MFQYNLINSTVADESDTDSDLEAAAGLSEPRSDSDHKSEQYHDYYEHVARSQNIRPIAVTEDVNFQKMSSSQKICWWISTALRLLR